VSASSPEAMPLAQSGCPSRTRNQGVPSAGAADALIKADAESGYWRGREIGRSVNKCRATQPAWADGSHSSRDCQRPRSAETSDCIGDALQKRSLFLNEAIWVTHRRAPDKGLARRESDRRVRSASPCLCAACAESVQGILRPSEGALPIPLASNDLRSRRDNRRPARFPWWRSTANARFKDSICDSRRILRLPTVQAGGLAAVLYVGHPSPFHPCYLRRFLPKPPCGLVIPSLG
jgi:hypothetical protein